MKVRLRRGRGGKRMTWWAPAAVGLSLVCGWAWLPCGSPPAGPSAPCPTATAVVFPPPQAVVRHYFEPLGWQEYRTAVDVVNCETGGTWDASLVGAAGELGLFQLRPEGGAGQRFADAGWDLLDAQQNVIAAALVVARDGWSSWSACLR